MRREIALVWAVLAVVPGACKEPAEEEETPWTYSRVYTAGETWAYELTTTHRHDGAFEKREVGLSSHEVRPDATGEVVRWTSLSIEAPEGTITDESAAAQAVPPYEMSLLVDADMALPALTVPEMTGMITDLFTYYVAVSSSLGVTELHAPGDVYTPESPVQGDWSDGAGTPVGQDCIVPSIEFLELDVEGKLARFETRFEVPDDPDCFEWIHESWSAPVVEGKANNFQQVLDLGGALFAMYGVEWFTIRTEVDTTDGRIRSATMENRLDLRTLGGCDDEWQNCGHDAPLVIEREEQLVLP